jgi:hypothetical protein
MAATSIDLTDPPFKHAGGQMRGMCGVGGQMFTELFRTSAQVPTKLADRLAELRLGHSRIAVQSEAVDPGSGERQALMNTLAVADRMGANVNLTWWHGPYFRNGSFAGKELMHGFADLIEEARRRFACDLHVTIQNEPNSHDIGHAKNAAASMEVYNQLYRLLVDELNERPDPRRPVRRLRAVVRLVGGDLVAGGPAQIPGSEQKDWIDFMQKHMADVLNGYSIHVYWASEDYPKMEGRLSRLLDFHIGKPIYVTEYGVRGADFSHKNRPFDPGSLHDRNVEDSLESAFQHGWFNALAPQYGVVGLAKWACYRIDSGTTTPAGKRRPERDSGMISGVGKNFAPAHTFRVTKLFNRTVGRNWKATKIGTAADTLVSVFGGQASGRQSLLALNRGKETNQLKISKLLPSRRYFAAAWNQGGDGAITQLNPVTSDENGVVNVAVPPSGLVALSTRSFAL